MDLFVWRGCVESSMPVVMRSKYDLLAESYRHVCLAWQKLATPVMWSKYDSLAEIYGAVCLEWFCETPAEMSRHLVVRWKYELLGEIEGPACLEQL